MNFFKRLNDLEQRLADAEHDRGDAVLVAQVLNEFAAASDENKAMLHEAAELAKTRVASRIVRHEECGELRKALGKFCRIKRKQFPGAKLIRLPSCGPGKSDANRMLMGGNGDLLQLYVCGPEGVPQ